MELKVKDFATREMVTVRTVRRWIEKGAVPVRRTPGGGIRVLVDRRTASGVVILDMSSGDIQGQSSQ